MTLLDILWKDLLGCIDNLMRADEIEWSKRENIRCQGRAEGIAWCIAVLTHSPSPPDINLIKEEAMERWEATA